MIEIPVELGKDRYLISIGHDLTRVLPDLLAPLGGRPMALVSSPRIWKLHGRRLEKSLAELGPVARILIGDAEARKSRATWSTLQSLFLEAGLARDGLVIAFGGGVVGDVAGFAAATYMRGLDFVQIPTTLLAMVDASIGGKVGINHPKAKNLIGAFHQPKAVIVDPAFLETLPPRQLRSGAYEVLKCGVIGDRTLVEGLERPRGLQGWSRIDMENAVASACRIKAAIVEKDEREAGLRRVLNLGHTLGHALEAATDYRRFTHGEAVGWGLVGASWIARRRGLLAQSSFDTIASAVDHLGRRPRVSDLRLEKVLEALDRDKKKRRGRIPFVLPTRIGRVVIREDVTRAEIGRALSAMASRE
jgi:3-dehydroquinate synthase